jgi:hypothetical protein
MAVRVAISFGGRDAISSVNLSCHPMPVSPRRARGRPHIFTSVTLGWFTSCTRTCAFLPAAVVYGRADDFPLARLVSKAVAKLQLHRDTRVSAGGSYSRFFPGRLAIQTVGNHYKWRLVPDGAGKQMPVISSFQSCGALDAPMIRCRPSPRSAVLGVVGEGPASQRLVTSEPTERGWRST